MDFTRDDVITNLQYLKPEEIELIRACCVETLQAVEDTREENRKYIGRYFKEINQNDGTLASVFKILDVSHTGNPDFQILSYATYSNLNGELVRTFNVRSLSYRFFYGNVNHGYEEIYGKTVKYVEISKQEFLSHMQDIHELLSEEFKEDL